jgi:hypothetical protein
VSEPGDQPTFDAKMQSLVASFRELARRVAREEVQIILARWRPVPAFSRSEVPVPQRTGPLAAQYEACPKCGK